MKFIRFGKLLGVRRIADVFFTTSIQHLQFAESSIALKRCMSGGFANVKDSHFVVHGLSVSLKLDSNADRVNPMLENESTYQYICYKEFGSYNRDIIVILPADTNMTELKEKFDQSGKFKGFECIGTLTLSDDKMIDNSDNGIDFYRRLYN